MTQKLKTASVLAFERKLANSDGLMYACRWQNRLDDGAIKPVALQEKSIRGTISNREKSSITSDPAKLDAKIEKPNLQTVDVAALPFDYDTLKLSFTLRVLSGLDEPVTCNSPEYQEALAAKINGYIQEYGLKELARRYAHNIANGRFLWRNRVGAEAIEVQVKQILQDHTENEWTFNAHDIGLREFNYDSDHLDQLADVIEQGLLNDTFAFFEINAFVRLGEGQEVFPSQELVLDDNASGNKGNKSKHLYSVDDIAGMHSQKIGNALRTIDDWYPQAEELGPIAVEPYGSVTNRGAAYRQPKEKMDFYNLLDNWVLKDKVPEVEQQHYVIATLIRGGVFSEKS